MLSIETTTEEDFQVTRAEEEETEKQIFFDSTFWEIS